MAGEKPLPIPGSSATNTEQSQLGVAESSLFEALGATAIDVGYDNFAPSIYRGGQNIIQGLSDSPTLSVEDLKSRYSDLSDIFDKPLKLNQAATIAERERFRRVLRDVVANGPDTKTAAVLKFGTGLLTGFVDPLSIAAGAGVTAAIARAGKAIPAISSLSVRAGTTIGQRAIIGAVEGTIGNAIEQPFVLAASALDSGGHDLDDVKLSILLSPIMGAAIGGAAGAISKRIHAKKLGMSAPVYNETKLLLEHQLNEGKVLDTSHLDIFDKSRKYNPDFQYKKFEPATDFQGKTFYIPSNKAGSTMTPDGLAKVADDFGDGVYMTDDLVTANRAAPLDDVQPMGSVFEATFKEEPRVLDMDTVATLDDLTILQEAGVKNADAKTIKEALKELTPEQISVVKEHLSSRYDVAMHSGGDEASGVKHTKSNTMIVLNADKLDVKYKNEVDPSMLRTFAEVDGKTAELLQNGDVGGLSTKQYEEFTVRANTPERSSKIIEIDETLKVSEEQIKQHIEQGYLDKTELDTASAAEARFLKEYDMDQLMYKMAFGCE